MVNALVEYRRAVLHPINPEAIKVDLPQTKLLKMIDVHLPMLRKALDGNIELVLTEQIEKDVLNDALAMYTKILNARVFEVYSCGRKVITRPKFTDTLTQLQDSYIVIGQLMMVNL